VLSTPPAFVLSQDQTLHRKTENLSKPKNDQLANNRQESSFVNSKRTSTTTPKGHGNGEFIQTNSSTNTLLSSQKSDAQQLRPVKGFIESWVAASGPEARPTGLASRRTLATGQNSMGSGAPTQIGRR
jgi:hypothetical protein